MVASLTYSTVTLGPASRPARDPNGWGSVAVGWGLNELAGFSYDPAAAHGPPADQRRLNASPRAAVASTGRRKARN